MTLYSRFDLKSREFEKKTKKLEKNSRKVLTLNLIQVIIKSQS